MAVLEFSIREDLNKSASRYMAVMNPLKVKIVNFPVGGVEPLDAVNNPENPADGTRQISFGDTIYIDRSDFMENPPKKYFRLTPGGEVRLRYGYFIRCVEVIKDASGEVVELHCTYDPETRGGSSPDGRKVKGTIHWVDAASAVRGEARLYDRLFKVENPGEGGADFLQDLNGESMSVVECYCEKALAEVEIGTRVQFERQGYFCKDKDSRADYPVFNRTVTLKDSWAKEQNK